VLHEVVEGAPSGIVGGMFPVAVMTIGAGMVPNGVERITVVGDVIVAVVPGVDVEAVPAKANGTGTSTGVIEGDDSGGTPGGCGAGTVEPGNTLVDDVSGCWANVSGVIATVGVE